jgi:methyl-accepting chemotaxis protein
MQPTTEITTALLLALLLCLAVIAWLAVALRRAKGHTRIQAAGQWVANEIAQTQPLNQTLQGQLGSVIEGTERAAFDITERLLKIDSKVTELDELIAKTIVSSGRMAADSAAEIANNKGLIDAMHGYIRFRMEEAELDRTRVQEVLREAQALSSLVQLIKGIALQTNLLALNAAIEAAWAGDAGRGFAVVATEVRKMSQETEQVVLRINEGIDKVACAINVQFQDKLEQEKIDAERETLASFAGQLDGLNQKYGQLIESQTQVALTIGRNSHELKTLFMDAMASVQFQDVTRQQVEQAIHTLDQLDQHCAHLAERLIHADDARFEEMPLAEKMAQIFDNYVMDSQRQHHAQAMAGGSSNQVASSNTPALAVELF